MEQENARCERPCNYFERGGSPVPKTAVEPVRQERVRSRHSVYTNGQTWIWKADRVLEYASTVVRRKQCQPVLDTSQCASTVIVNSKATTPIDALQQRRVGRGYGCCLVKAEVLAETIICFCQ